MRAWTVVMVVATLLAACGRQDAPLKELQRAKSGSMDIVLLSSNDAIRQGKDTVVLEFRNASAALVDVGTVTVNATMTMAGMAPMIGDGVVTPSATKGRYDVATDLSMAGTWRLNVAWDGPAGKGSVSMPGTAR